KEAIEAVRWRAASQRRILLSETPQGAEYGGCYEQCRGRQSGVTKAPFVSGCLAGGELRDRRRAVGGPAHSLRDLSTAEERNRNRLVGCGASAGICFNHSARRENYHPGATRCLGDHLSPNCSVRASVQGRDNPHPITRLSAS